MSLSQSQNCVLWVSSNNLLDISALFFLQEALPELMRQGLDEMLQFDKKPEEKMKVYTYENAVKRFNTLLFVIFKKRY